jgi:dTDP-L-rhamnose 4-epimerase
MVLLRPVPPRSVVSEMRILVTGSAGFIGGHVLRRLIEMGHCALPFDVLNGGNILDLNALEMAIDRGVEAVIHLAAQADLTKVHDLVDGGHVTEVNVIGHTQRGASMRRPRRLADLCVNLLCIRKSAHVPCQ